MDFDAKATGLPSHARNDRLHFFKYMNETTAKIVLNLGTLRWSTPEFLNDPFDMQFEMLLHGDIEGIKADALDKAWRLICGDKPITNETPISETLEGMRTERPRIKESDFRKRVGPAIDEVYKNMRDDLPSTLGEIRPLNARTKILSLSVRPDIPTMWSHYANSHRGIVLRFRSVGDSPYMMAKPINYMSEVPSFLTRDEMVGLFSGTHRIDVDEMASRMTYTKSSHWAYEQEWRIASGFGRDSTAGYEDVPFGLLELDGVIFGLKASQETADVVRLLAAKFPDVQFYKAVRDMTSFDISFEEFG